MSSARLWPSYFAVAALLVAASSPTLARAGSATVTGKPAAAWAGDTGVGIECRDSLGGKTIIPAPVAATFSFGVTGPDNGLPVSVKCTAFRGTDAAATARSVEVSATSATSFPLAAPENLSVR